MWRVSPLRPSSRQWICRTTSPSYIQLPIMATASLISYIGLSIRGRSANVAQRVVSNVSARTKARAKSRSRDRKSKGVFLNIKQCRTIEEVAQMASDRIGSLSPGIFASIWTQLASLSTNNRGSNVARRGDQNNTNLLTQLNTILHHTKKSLDIFEPKFLPGTILAMSKIIQNAQHPSGNGKVGPLQQVLLGDHPSKTIDVLQPFLEESNNRLKDFDARNLSDLAYACALIGKNPMLNDGSNLLERIADESLGRLDTFNGMDFSNMMWSYASLRHEAQATLFKKIGDTITDSGMKKYAPQELSDILRAFAKVDDESHLILFEKVGDFIASCDDLRTFKPRDLSNIIWAFATSNSNHPAAFERIGNVFAEYGYLKMSKPQDISKTVWAFATAKCDHPSMFQQIGDHISCANLTLFQPKHLANILWAFATVKHDHPRLFKTVGDRIASYDSLQKHKFIPQDISMTVWAFATACEPHPLLFKKVGDCIAGSNNLRSYSPQSLANTVWAFATADYKHLGMFTKIANTIAGYHDLEKLFKEQELSNIAWAFKTVGVDHSVLEKHFKTHKSKAYHVKSRSAALIKD